MSEYTILMIDDEPVYTTAFKFLMESKGDYKIFLASDAKQGLELAKEKTPDLIFLDIMMPGEDGIEVLKRLKSDDKLKNIPVVMMTAVETELAHKETFALHAEDYLNKPLEMDTVIAKVEAIRAKYKKTS
ncbi:MAG: response regulator [Candidatus Saganbacteria bacterium]|nr:response regulator [Candidatus Saganbacteria bacterium]